MPGSGWHQKLDVAWVKTECEFNEFRRRRLFVIHIWEQRNPLSLSMVRHRSIGVFLEVPKLTRLFPIRWNCAFSHSHITFGTRRPLLFSSRWWLAAPYPLCLDPLVQRMYGLMKSECLGMGALHNESLAASHQASISPFLVMVRRPFSWEDVRQAPPFCGASIRPILLLPGVAWSVLQNHLWISYSNQIDRALFLVVSGSTGNRAFRWMCFAVN